MRIQSPQRLVSKLGSASDFFGWRSRRMRKIQPANLFHTQLLSERTRADRSGLPFTLLCVHTDPAPTRPGLHRKLDGLLAKNLRQIDAATIYPDGSIVILLPYTRASERQTLLKKLRPLVAEYVPDFTTTTYEYPRDWKPQSPQDALAQRATLEGDDGSQSATDANPTARTPRATNRTVAIRSLPRISFTKHLLDVTGASLALLLLSPLLVVTALLIKFTSPGPALFTQVRMGRGGRPFRIYKFRTMQTHAESLRASLLALSEQDGPAFKIQDDPRITPVGRFLRRSSIDELPQLLNILLRQMSFVGPRPLPYQEAAACNLWQHRRHDVLPGLTCRWQIEGRSRVPFEQWMRMDLDYVNHHSTLRDIQLVSKTIPAVITGRGAM